MSASHPSGAATIAAKVAGRLADLDTMPEMMRGIARAIIMSDLRDDIWRLLASRSSAPTFPPKPLLTDANAADRCVHGTYPPAICEHCQRQATTQEAVTLPTIIARMRAIGKDPAMVRSDVLLLFANDLEKVLARSQG